MPLRHITIQCLLGKQEYSLATGSVVLLYSRDACKDIRIERPLLALRVHETRAATNEDVRRLKNVLEWERSDQL